MRDWQKFNYLKRLKREYQKQGLYYKADQVQHEMNKLKKKKHGT